MAKSYAQNLLAGFNQLHPATPDLSPYTDSSFTLPGSPAQEAAEPIPDFAAQLTHSSPSSFAATHTLSNAAFFPITSIPGQSPQETRLAGLSAYVTQDIDPTASLTANQIFGNTPQFANDHNSNMAVGRAVASAHGYTGDPALFLREKGSTLGYIFPADLANEYQLYAHIGETFSQRERKSAQERIATQNARRPSQKEMEEYLPKALLKAVTSGKLNWVESSLIKRAGIPESSIRKARYILQSGKLPGITRGWRKELNSKFNDLEIDELAKYVKDDPVTRYILLELARKEGYDARSAMHDKDGIKRFGKAIIEGARNLREPFTHAVKEVGSDVSKSRLLSALLFTHAVTGVGSDVATAINNVLDGKTSLSAIDENYILSVPDEAEDRQRRAFRADFANAYNTGYNQRTEELRNNLKDSFSFNLSNLLMSAGNIVGETLPYFNPTSALFSIGGMAGDEMNKAAANALRDDALNSASGWELYGAPATKATIFGASIAATGGLAKGGISLVSRTAIGRAAADRLAISPSLSYASRFAEGTATEAAEELTNALGQEAFELTGLVADRQKEAHLSQFAETMASPEFWGANIGMNLGLAAFGLKGSRSKAPYKAFQDLKNIGFSAKESRAIVKNITQAVRNGASPNDAQNIVSDAILIKLASSPKETQQKLLQVSRELAAQKAIEDAAASGVRDFLIQEADISDMQKQPNGKIKAKLITHNEQGQFESVEHELTEQELNDYLLANLDSAITQEIINTQALVRGEQLARAAESSKSSPFARIASLQDAPAEVLANLKGKDTFDADTLSTFASYAINRINQGNTSDFGDTSVPLQNVANVATAFQERIRIAREKGELKPGESAESTAFILPGKTTADNILMLARGQVSAQSIAHDWLEGFARARYDADPSYWRDVLDSVDRELLQNKVTSQSLFASPENSRSDLDYIEAFSHLAQSSWLAHHDNLAINDTAHALADEMLEDLGSVQNGLAVAQELARYLDSEAAQKAIGEGIDPLRQILTQAGASLTDLLQEAEKQAPKTAADFILQHRQRIQQELDSLAQEADAIDSAPPLTAIEPNTELQNTTTGISAPDGSPITLQDAAKINGISPLDGTLSSTPPSAYTTVTAPNGAGKGLNGGIAHRLRDGSIEGAAPTASLTLHKSLAGINLSNAQGIIDAPVICYRTKDGHLHVIGGFARLAHDQALGLTNTHVKVYPASKKHDAQWASDRATQESIRSGIASTRNTLKYLIKHKLSRTQARKRNLIPSDINGQELPTSRAAWLLLHHASPQTVAQVSTGKLSLQEALSSIASQEPSKSYSAKAKELAPLFQEDGSLHTQNAIITKPGASFSIQALHASRHNFRKFSTDFMGSGEGTQAFGWGLYFATNKKVNKSYFSLFNIVKREITKEYQDFYEELKTTGYHWDNSVDPSDNEDLVYTIELFIKNETSLKESAQKSLSAWETPAPRLFEELRNNIKEELSKRPKGKFARFFFNYTKINEAIKRYKKQVEDYNFSPFSTDNEKQSKMAWNRRQKERKIKTKELSEKIEDSSRKLAKLQELRDRAKTIVMEALIGSGAYNYKVELNVDDSNLLMWDTRIPRELHILAHKEVLLGNYEEVKEIVATERTLKGKQLYRQLADVLGSKKEASEWLYSHGIKGAKYLDRISRRKGEGTYNYVIFSGDDIKITAVNESGLWSMDEGWEEYTDTTASFSLSPKKNRRRYTKLADMVKHEQFLALLDEAKRIERQSINFINPEQDLDSTLTNAAKLNGLLNAIYSILPKDARPWKVLPYLEKRFHAFAKLSVNPHLPADPNADYASAFTADEITRYNELLPQERRTYISQKLARAYKELAVATARSLEAHLSRSLFAQVERTIKTLQPKQQPSGKEKRSITSATTFRKAMQFYDMMAWSPAQVTTRQNELLAAITQENASEEQIDANQRELNALSLFGALRSADLDQTQRAVSYFMEFIELGKEQWRDHLADERETARAVRLAVAKLKPSVRSSAVDKKAKSALSIAGGMLDSFMNTAQTIHTLSGLQGEAGAYFSKTLTDLCTNLDNCYLSIDSYKKKADALLDQQLGIAHLPSIVRDAKRAAFLVDANQYKHPGIFREGTHPVHNYQFTKRDVEHLIELKKAGDTDALKTAINNCLTGSNVELPLPKRPALRALADAISQYQDKNYQGGTIFVQTYDKRDSAHVEELDITPLQAANLVLMAEQPSYANKYDDDGKLIEQGTMDLNGYTESVLAQLEHYAGSKLMSWLRQCRQLFDTTGLFDAYEEQVGLPFPREENYWPGIFETPKQGTMTDALDAASKGVGLHQMLIKRRDHISPPNITISATDAWERAISQHFFYIHLSPITRELRRVFRNTDFQTRLKDLTSPQAIDNLIQLFDTIDGAPNLCLRASQPFNKSYAALTGKQALNTLAGMTSSATKNFTGYLNGTAYQGINAFNLIPYTLKGVSGLGHATPATIAKLPVFQTRLHRDSLTGDANRLNPGQKQTALHAFGLYGMRAFMEYPDYTANLLSMTAVYNCHYDTLLTALKQERGKHYTPTPEDIAQIKKSCEQAVSVTMHRAAQPMEKTDKSAFLQTQNWAQNMTTYMKGEILIKIGLARDNYLHRRNQQTSSNQHKNPLQKNIDRFHAAWDFYKTLATFSLAGQGVAALLTILTGGAPDDEDEFQNWLLANTVAGLCGVGFLSLVPIIGDSLSAAGQFIFGERGVFATYSTAGIGGITKRNISNAYKLVTSDSDELNTGEKIVAYGDLSRFLGTLISTIGLKSTPLTAAGELITGCSALLNAVRPYGQYLKNTEKKATRARRELEQYQRHQRALLRKLLKSSSAL